MSTKHVFLVSSLFLLCVSSLAQAGEPELTVRQLPSAEYEAVINYDTDVYCFVEVTPASSVEVIGFEVLIESPLSGETILCIGPTPPFQYFEETAHIGALPPGNYTVSWTQPGAFSLSTSLDTTRAANAIPSSSPGALLLLVLGVLAVANLTMRTGNLERPK